MEMSEADFAASFRPSGPANAQEVLNRRLMAPPSRDEIEQDAAARAEATALAEQREELAQANTLAGNPLAQLSRAQQLAADARDQVRDLEAQLASAREVARHADGNVAAWASDVDEVRAGLARRSSAEHDLLAPAKAAHQQFAAATRAAIAAMEAGTPQRAPRPFAGHGSAVRSDQPVTCGQCRKLGASPEESWLIHNDPQPAEPPAVPDEAETAFMTGLGYSERRGHGSYTEIAR